MSELIHALGLRLQQAKGGLLPPGTELVSLEELEALIEEHEATADEQMQRVAELRGKLGQAVQDTRTARTELARANAEANRLRAEVQRARAINVPHPPRP